MGAWQPQLEELTQQRYGRLVALALMVAPSRSEAEDMVQDALVAAFSGRARFGSVDEAEGYVRRAVVSRSMDAHRRRGAERRALTRVAARPEAPSTDPEVMDPRVLAALRALAPRERACVVLRHVEDLSVRETAALLHLSEGAVKRYVHDAVAALDAALGTEPPHERDVVRMGGRRDA